MPKVRKTLPAALPDPEVLDLREIADSVATGSIDLIVVLGPTASGKTRFAVNLARELPFPCEIISADSRQVYRGMDIGTGKDIAEYGEVPCHLLDIAAPGTQYNVHSFCQDFAAAASDIRSRGAFPILCGGTGLYISAVTGGYDFSHTKPLSAPLAVPVAGGQNGVISHPESGIPADGVQNAPISHTFFIGTLVSREERNAKIDARLRARLDEGLVEEVRGLLDGTNPGCSREPDGEGHTRGIPVPAETLLGYGLEYKFVTLYLQGKLTEEELFTQLSTAIHQFAKRQMTWFRGMERSGIRIHWVRP